jgi:LmbE family N-acetylglucosaminyl deacetylase
MTDKPKVLFIGAHNDDCEYGAGGVAPCCRRWGAKRCF